MRCYAAINGHPTTSAAGGSALALSAQADPCVTVQRLGGLGNSHAVALTADRAERAAIATVRRATLVARRGTRRAWQGTVLSTRFKWDPLPARGQIAERAKLNRRRLLF